MCQGTYMDEKILVSINGPRTTEYLYGKMYIWTLNLYHTQKLNQNGSHT